MGPLRLTPEQYGLIGGDCWKDGSYDWKEVDEATEWGAEKA